MRSPSDMEFIQIDITNACNMRCSNCTRFCGNHEKTFFMDYETFKRAVDSLDGFDGVTGIIGGEPTLHPQFERFALYLREKFGRPSGSDALLYPQKDFIQTIHQREFESGVLRERADGSHYVKKHGAGLWSNMSAGYRRYYEVIQDTFSVEYLNDHMNPSYHQPGLFARKDLGIPDEEWIRLRDNCWIQNTWSATITPKGAFFCEIAGALDMLFDGPGGWKIEPGWWKRTPEEFGDQLHWCELCGFALNNTFTRDSQEETDDVSPTLYEKIKKLNSPKYKSGHINPVRIENGVITEDSKAEDKRFIVGDRYIEKYEDRFNRNNSVLFEMDYAEYDFTCWSSAAQTVQQPVDGDLFGQNAQSISSEENFGRWLNRMMQGKEEWILLKLSENGDTEPVRSLIGKRVFHPGVLLLGKDIALLCRQALSLRRIGYDRIAHMTSFVQLCEAWDADKVIRLSDMEEKTSLRRSSIGQGKHYAIWGAGMLGEFFAETIQLSGGIVELVVDKAPGKLGKPFYGVEIALPEELTEREESYDYLLIGHHQRFEEIEREAVMMGIPKDKILLPYEV